MTEPDDRRAADVVRDIERVAHEWDRAMVRNDPGEIARYMADEWVIIGPDGLVSDRARFLDLVGSGRLTHDVMETHDMDVRVYGDTALVIARGISAGRYDGQSFRLVERVSCVFVRQRGEWSCVSTHLSAMAER
jgi:ketosteroid isomerase-like protein